MSVFKKNQAVNVRGTKKSPDPRPGKYIATHPSSKGNFVEVLLDGLKDSNRFRESQVQAA